ncbi:MAG: hypothetical protein EOO06_04250 [Chitinophagaceae bacterium]|nr:MAG: hypothetical protein EOO06_04250 [Chitinophagaceae bacterium]
MIQAASNIHYREHFYRITALWVICEAFAGGIMHGIKIPFSGMVISSLAVFCIILLARYVPARLAILKATMIVALFKLMLSPHSPPTAYIAVFFQGLVGQLLFLRKTNFSLSAVLLAVLSLVESAIQRLLVLVILYGKAFWNAVDEFIKKITGNTSIDNFSLLLAGVYIFIHAVVGVAVGLVASKVVKRTARWEQQFSRFIITDESYKSDPLLTKTKKKKRKLKWIFVIAWLLLFGFYLQSLVDPQGAFLPKDKLTEIFIRSALLLLAWYLFIGPLLMMGIKSALLASQRSRKIDMDATMQLLPEMKMIFQKSWQYSNTERSVARLKLFFKILLINVLKTNNENL